MKKVYVGLVYESAEVMVGNESTVKEAFEAAGKSNLLRADTRVQLLSPGKQPRFVNATDTIGALGVAEGDELLVTENKKSAKEVK